MCFAAVVLIVLAYQASALVPPRNDDRPRTAAKLATTYTGSDFREMVEEKLPIIDKTLFIKEFNSTSKKTLITRPRGFGKSFNLSLLKHFFSRDANASHLFENLAIAEDKAFCEKYQNKGEVLFITFAGMNHSTFDESKGAFKAIARRLFQQNFYVVNSSHLTPAEEPVFKAFARGKISDTQIPEAFGVLVRYLHAVRGKLIILLDDYDAPILNGYMHKYYDQIRALTGDILKALFGDEFLEFGVVTGITNVGTKHLGFKEYSIHDGRFSEFFGFTDHEIETLVEKFGISTPGMVPRIEAMYTGYDFGNVTVHNSYDVVACLRRNGELEDHWVQAGLHERPYELWDEFGLLPAIKAEFMLGDVRPRQRLRKWLDLSVMDTDEDMFWTFVTRLGYVTFAETLATDENGDMLCALRVPNSELRGTIQFIVFGIPHHFKVETYNKFIDAFDWEQDVTATRIMTKYASATGKYFHAAPLKTVYGLLTGLEEEKGRLIQVPGDCEMHVFDKATNMILLRSVSDKRDLELQAAERWMIGCYEKIRDRLAEGRVTRQVVVSVLNATVNMQFYRYR